MFIGEDGKEKGIKIFAYVMLVISTSLYVAPFEVAKVLVYCLLVFFGLSAVVGYYFRAYKTIKTQRLV